MMTFSDDRSKAQDEIDMFERTILTAIRFGHDASQAIAYADTVVGAVRERGGYLEEEPYRMRYTGECGPQVSYEPLPIVENIVTTEDN